MGRVPWVMTATIEVPEELLDRLESHTDEDETVAEFVAELVSMYETEGRFFTEGYSED